MTLVIGLAACAIRIADEPRFAVQARYCDAVAEVLGAAVVLLPPQAVGVTSVLDGVDGLLLPGSRTNVHPARYGVAQSATPDRHDLARDASTLLLIAAAFARNMPVLGICRGCQELNVALGGTLLQEVHAAPGRLDHRAHEDDPHQRFRHRHTIRAVGVFAELIGSDEIMVNSLHGQAIDRLGPTLIAEGWAPDGTIEAIRSKHQEQFALGVQFHPEWDTHGDGPSRRIFEAFGQACVRYRAMRKYG